MPVTRLKTAHDRQLSLGLDQLRADIEAAGSVPQDLQRRLIHLVDRERSARSGWRFVMIDPRRYADVLHHLVRHSRRPQAATMLWAELFAHLPDDSNEVLLSQRELAEAIGVQPKVVSEVVSELAEIGAVYRRKAGRNVKLYVHPLLGTHLKGAIRDSAQAEAPPLLLPGMDNAGNVVRGRFRERGQPA